MKELLMDPDYSSIISLMLDGEVKAKGDNYLIFVYESKNLDEYFNSILVDIENALKKVFNKELKPIAIDNDSWEINIDKEAKILGTLKYNDNAIIKNIAYFLRRVNARKEEK